MLNISDHSIKDAVQIEQYSSYRKLMHRKNALRFQRLLTMTLVTLIVIMFVPWTQNIRSKGNVIALQPDQRPQSIHSVIPGRIEKWFVKEGQLVHKGDTIIFLSETKDEYFDPALVNRTEDQLKAKELSVGSYMEKVKALDNQVDILLQTKNLKIEQARNKLLQAELKVKSDSMDLQASRAYNQIAQTQLTRTEGLYKEGIKSLAELEAKRISFQESLAKMIAQENKLLSSRNEVINAQVELKSIEAEYRDKIYKTESEKYAAMSDMYDAEATVTKLQNQVVNYSTRRGMYYVTAPQDGYITRATKTGIGETIKEGTEIVTIMPLNFDLAIEMFVEPIDLPLVKKEQKVRIRFDGWPAIVFSGWPNTSYGTYGGKVVAIDNFISANGKFRVLVAPDEKDHDWPSALRVGAGASAMALLNDVPVWYEVWRKLNGFPPDYYQPQTEKKK